MKLMKLVDVRRLSAELGVSERQVQRLVQLGMPRAERGKYDLVACLAWMIARWKEQIAAAREKEGGLEFERMRATRAQADNLEHQLRARRATLIPADVAAAHAKAHFDAVRRAFLEDLDGLAGRLAGKDRHEIKRVFHERNCAVLAKLATGDYLRTEPRPVATVEKKPRPRRRRSKAAHARRPAHTKR